MSDDLHLPITRCPHCKTAFRVREAQLTLRHGMVRCGACRGVFNAIQHLLHQRGDTITIMPASGAGDQQVPDGFVAAPAQLNPLTLMPEGVRTSAVSFETPKPTAAPIAAAAVSAPSTSPTPSPAPALAAKAVDFNADSFDDTKPAASDAANAPATDAVEGITFGTAAAASAATAVLAVAGSASATGAADVDTLASNANNKSTERGPITKIGRSTKTDVPLNADATSELSTDILEARLAGEARPQDATDRFEWKPKRARSPAWVGALWSLAALALTALLIGQAALIFRNDLALRVPALRAPLTQFCGMLGCKVAAPERPSSIVIDGAEFQADPAHSGLYIFSATLKNRHDHAAAYPHLVMTLTGLNNQILARRLFSPQEFVPGNADLKAGLAGQSEVEFKLWIDASTISPLGFDVRTTYAPAAPS
jgi:predicted Zn finger-like uncharacterized protein